MLKTINKPLDRYYIVGVSGGPDSMVLLSELVQQGYKVVAAHVNYNHRGSDSLRDQKIVETFCKEHNVIFETVLVGKLKGNFESVARDYRYEYYAGLVDKYQAAGVFLGHQQDDHLETYLMQKDKKGEYFYYGIRKEGKVGRITIFRPLLDFSKQELKEYADSIGLAYGVDLTNYSDEHTRNRHRKTIARMTKDERENLLKEIEDANKELQEKNKRLEHLSVIFEDYNQQQYTAYSLEDRVHMIRYYLFSKGIENAIHYSNNHLLEIDKQLASKDNQRIILDDNYLWDKDYGKLYLHKMFTSFSYSFDKMISIDNEYFSIDEKGTSLEGAFIKEGDYPITIRNYKPSDSIDLRFGKKKLSRFFIDRKIPHYQRERWPVLLNKDNVIILVPGIGCCKDSYKQPYNFYLHQK